MTDASETVFVVGPWSWNPDDGELTCTYSIAEQDFAERFSFGVSREIDEALARSFDLLAVTAGVSYFKTKAPLRIEIQSLAASPDWEGYVTNLYDKGLREFRVRNGLPLAYRPVLSFGEPRSSHPRRSRAGSGALVPMGGGRDSLLVAFALRSIHPTLATIGGNPIVDLQAKSLGLDLHTVSRRLDPLLLELNHRGALNGHVPVTAINSCVAIVLAQLLDKADVVFSNERSAGMPTRIVDGIPVNHQYSKSGEFEDQLRKMLSALDIPVRYFSALRRYGETDVSRLIGKHWGDLPPFVSCNRARTLDKSASFPTWCGTCSKCYFVFLALAPYVSRPNLVEYFGRDLLAEPSDSAAIEELLLGDDRDFECIGTRDETRQALAEAASGQWSDVPSLQELVRRHRVARSEISPHDIDVEAYAVPPAYQSLLDSL